MFLCLSKFFIAQFSIMKTQRMWIQGKGGHRPVALEYAVSRAKILGPTLCGGATLILLLENINQKRGHIPVRLCGNRLLH